MTQEKKPLTPDERIAKKYDALAYKAWNEKRPEKKHKRHKYDFCVYCWQHPKGTMTKCQRRDRCKCGQRRPGAPRT